jgi:hypothetical protein
VLNPQLHVPLNKDEDVFHGKNGKWLFLRCVNFKDQLNDINEPCNLTMLKREILAKLNTCFEGYVDIPRTKVKQRQTLETLISEEALLFAEYLRKERTESNNSLVKFQLKLKSLGRYLAKTNLLIAR